MKLTESQKDVLEELRQTELEWCRPMDIGAWDGSSHSTVLNQLVKKGLVERKPRPTIANAFRNSRGSYVYRIK